MSLDELEYELPAELIAQYPAERREDARLLVVDRRHDHLEDRRMSEIANVLATGDCLVLNETRVIPARLVTRRVREGDPGGRVELLLVRPEPNATWRVLAKPARKAPAGARLETEDGALVLEVVETGAGGERVVRVVEGVLRDALERLGEVPLPPYIHRPVEPLDRERYQTVYARVDGAVAAPTAGLHFTPELLASLEARGVTSAKVVLHVGPGTFRPITVPDPADHRMDEEAFEVPAAAAATLAETRARGGRIVAVGTTAVRALESACDVNGGAIGAASGWTRKFILPPYRFRAVDALLTNFHLPRTTLLLLVAALAGRELTRRAYAHAVAERYRFYSYGDAMLII